MSCYLAVKSQNNSKVKRLAADVCALKRSDEFKRWVKWYSAGRRALFMDIISLMAS